MMKAFLLSFLTLLFPYLCYGFSVHQFSSPSIMKSNSASFLPKHQTYERKMGLKMNFFEDAFKFLSNMNREASAKHILISGPDASKKLEVLKAELDGAEDLSAAFSEIASKVSECPSAKRGGNLGTFKPGMMVKEFDEIVFNKEVGKIHGPISTQFGSHLIYITRRYEGEDKKS